MAFIRRIEVTRDKRRWEWRLGWIRWQYRIVPRHGLYRNGIDLTRLIEDCLILCPDDAVLFSLAYEAGIDSTVAFEKGGGKP